MREETEAEVFEALQKILGEMRSFIDQHTKKESRVRYDLYMNVDNLRAEVCRKLFALE